MLLPEHGAWVFAVGMFCLLVSTFIRNPFGQGAKYKSIYHHGLIFAAICAVAVFIAIYQRVALVVTFRYVAWGVIAALVFSIFHWRWLNRQLDYHRVHIEFRYHGYDRLRFVLVSLLLVYWIYELGRPESEWSGNALGIIFLPAYAFVLLPMLLLQIRLVERRIGQELVQELEPR